MVTFDGLRKKYVPKLLPLTTYMSHNDILARSIYLAVTRLIGKQWTVKSEIFLKEVIATITIDARSKIIAQRLH